MNSSSEAPSLPSKSVETQMRCTSKSSLNPSRDWSTYSTSMGPYFRGILFRGVCVCVCVRDREEECVQPPSNHLLGTHSFDKNNPSHISTLINYNIAVNNKKANSSEPQSKHHKAVPGSENRFLDRTQTADTKAPYFNMNKHTLTKHPSPRSAAWSAWALLGLKKSERLSAFLSTYSVSVGNCAAIEIKGRILNTVCTVCLDW